MGGLDARAELHGHRGPIPLNMRPSHLLNVGGATVSVGLVDATYIADDTVDTPLERRNAAWGLSPSSVPGPAVALHAEWRPRTIARSSNSTTPDRHSDRSN